MTQSEWGPAERFVSGAAAASAPSPFADVQSVPRCDATVRNTGLEMQKTPKCQVLLLELEAVGSPCRVVRCHVAAHSEACREQQHLGRFPSPRPHFRHGRGRIRVDRQVLPQ